MPPDCSTWYYNVVEVRVSAPATALSLRRAGNNQSQLGCKQPSPDTVRGRSRRPQPAPPTIHPLGRHHHTAPPTRPHPSKLPTPRALPPSRPSTAPSVPPPDTPPAPPPEP